MALYSVSVSNASPLLLQLTAGVAGVEIVGFDAFGEGGQGASSRPVIYRPSTPGIARASDETAVVVCMSRDGGLSNRTARIASVFAVSPSFPLVSKHSPGLPYRASERWAPGKGIRVKPGDVVCLYAATDFKASAASQPTGAEITDQSENKNTEVEALNKPHRWSATLWWEE